MKTDRYTKTVLTVIAVCLCILVIKNVDLFPKAHASDPGTLSPFTTHYGVVPLNEDGSITVRLAGTEELDVNIKNIDTYDELRVDIRNINTDDELDINIDEIGGGWINNGGPIKVQIQQ